VQEGRGGAGVDDDGRGIGDGLARTRPGERLHRKPRATDSSGPALVLAVSGACPVRCGRCLSEFPNAAGRGAPGMFEKPDGRRIARSRHAPGMAIFRSWHGT